MNSPPINNELMNRLRKKMARASAPDTPTTEAPVLEIDETLEISLDSEDTKEEKKDPEK